MAQVGSVVTNHLHCWGAVPPVTVAVRVRAVPTSRGEGGVAVTVTGRGVMVKASPALASGASVVFPLLRAQTPTW